MNLRIWIPVFLATFLLVMTLAVYSGLSHRCNPPDWESCGLPAPGYYVPDGRGGLVNEHGVQMPQEWLGG